MTPCDVLVLGGGISGLTSAHLLARAGVDVRLAERQAHPGGRMQSEVVNGFLMEHGPSSLVAPAPQAEELVLAAGLGTERVFKGDGVRRRYLVREGKSQGIPITPMGFFFSSYLSWKTRIRMIQEPLVPASAKDETVAEWTRRRFGDGFLNSVVDPLVGGLLAGDPARLSMEAAFPRLKQMERERGSVLLSVIESRLKRRSRSIIPGQRTLFSFSQGMAMLPRTLARQLEGRINLGLQAESVEPLAGSEFLVRLRCLGECFSIRAKCVIVALPGHAAASLFAHTHPDLAHDMSGIAHPPLAVVFQGYRRSDIDHPLDGLGYLTPSHEKRHALGTMFSSTLFAGRAPDGHVALTTFIGGARQPELARLPLSDLEAIARAEAKEILGARAAPMFTRVRRWSKGLPQPDIDHGFILRRLHNLEQEHPGLFITGNYLSGVSVAVCIAKAADTASKTTAYLNSLNCTQRVCA